MREFHIRLSDTVAEKIEAIAVAEDRTLISVFRRLVHKGLANEKSDSPGTEQK